MTDVGRVHPLAATVDELTTISSYLKVQLDPPVGEGWIATTDLLGEVSPRREELLARLHARYKTTDRHFVAMTFFGSYLWQVVVAGIAGFLSAGRVPALTPANVELHWDAEGWADRLALKDGRFAALPDDPAAGHPDVTVVADRDALRAYLAERIVHDYAPPMIDALSASSPLGKPALWGALADRCAGTTVWLAQELGQAATCRDDVAALIEAAPLKVKSGVLAVEHGGRDHLFLQRCSCCLSYKMAEQDYCSTCPLLPLAERVRRLREYAAAEATA